MRYTLHDIAQISSGLTIRDREELLPAGAVRVIQLRSFDGPSLNLDKVDYLKHLAPARRNLLADGDLILRSRGRFDVGVYRGDEPPTVASAPLLVIRLLHDGLLPEYLQWLLNEAPEVRAHFGRSWQGTTVPAITIADLRQIEVPVPPIETQKRIVQVATLVRQEHDLEHQLADKRRQYHRGLLSVLARRDGGPPSARPDQPDAITRNEKEN